MIPNIKPLPQKACRWYLKWFLYYFSSFPHCKS